MKKIINVGCIMLLSVVLCSCGNNTDKAVKGEDSAITEDNKSYEVEENNIISENTIRELFDENLYFMINIFELSSLPTVGEPLDGDNIYQVDESYFKDYNEFESRIRSIYTKETADRLLYNFPYEGVQKYFEKDGKLCVNKMYDGGKGYYADWSDYTITIDSFNENECNFTLKAVVIWPADEPKEEIYEVNATAVYENEKWLLTEMVY